MPLLAIPWVPPDRPTLWIGSIPFTSPDAASVCLLRDWAARCNHLAFFHVEWHCFAGAELAGLRRRALERGAAALGGLTRDSLLTHFYPLRLAKFVTCLRHPIDRLISISWYGESSHGMQYMKHLHATRTIGFDNDGNDLSIRPEGDHKRTW